MRIVLCLFYLSLMICSSLSNEFPWEIADIAGILSSYSYCNHPITFDKSEYLIQGFTVASEISDSSGFIGYLPSKSLIIIVYRGSKDLPDYMYDVNAELTNYTTCHDCKVHAGFYLSEQLGIFSVIYTIQKLKKKFPSYKVIITGHSMGILLS